MLILGIIAIGIFAYWLVSQANKTTETGSSAECQARAFSYCVQWQVKGGFVGPAFEWGDCGNEKLKYEFSKSKCEELGIEIK